MAVKTLIERSVVLGQGGDKPLAMWSNGDFDLPGLLAQTESQRRASSPLICLEISCNCLAGAGGSRAGQELLSVHCSLTHTSVRPDIAAKLCNHTPRRRCDQSYGHLTQGRVSGSCHHHLPRATWEDVHHLASPKNPASAESWSKLYRTENKGAGERRKERMRKELKKCVIFQSLGLLSIWKLRTLYWKEKDM